MATISLKGLGDVQSKIKALSIRYPDAARAALYQMGLKIMAESVKRTPVDTGRLRASAYVGPPEGAGADIKVHLGYGTDYAAAVHERTEVHHEVGQAKFLESALSDATGEYQKDLAARIKDNADHGIGMSLISAEFPEKPSED